MLGVTGAHADPPRLPRKADSTVLGQVGTRSTAAGSSTTPCRSPPWPSSSWPPTRASPGSRGLRSVLARDGLMPRQFMNRGDKLVFSNGIIGLTVAAIVVLVIFGGQTHRLIPLYAVGVFTSFTLSQSGMVIHWCRLQYHGLAAPGGHERRGRGADRGRDGRRPRHQVHPRRLPRGDRCARPDQRSSTSSAATTTASPTSSSRRTRRNWSGWARWPSPSRGPPWCSSCPRSTS